MQRMYVLLAITAIFLLAAHTAAVATQQADNPPVTFRSDVSLGRVDAQVVDGGNHPIRGLRVHDFILRVDGEVARDSKFPKRERCRLTSSCCWMSAVAW